MSQNKTNHKSLAISKRSFVTAIAVIFGLAVGY